PGGRCTPGAHRAGRRPRPPYQRRAAAGCGARGGAVTRRGFTLLETLGALARSLAGAARSRSLATAESDRLAAARTILLRLGAELEAAAGEAGIVVEPDAGPGLSSGSRVHLVTTVRTDASTLPASDRRAVAYEVDRAAGVLLRREETAPMAPEAATPAP